MDRSATQFLVLDAVWQQRTYCIIVLSELDKDDQWITRTSSTVWQGQYNEINAMRMLVVHIGLKNRFLRGKIPMMSWFRRIGILSYIIYVHCTSNRIQQPTPLYLSMYICYQPARSVLFIPRSSELTVSKFLRCSERASFCQIKTKQIHSTPILTTFLKSFFAEIASWPYEKTFSCVVDFPKSNEIMWLCPRKT